MALWHENKKHMTIGHMTLARTQVRQLCIMSFQASLHTCNFLDTATSYSDLRECQLDHKMTPAATREVSVCLRSTLARTLVYRHDTLRSLPQGKACSCYKPGPNQLTAKH